MHTTELQVDSKRLIQDGRPNVTTLVWRVYFQMRPIALGSQPMPESIQRLTPAPFHPFNIKSMGKIR